MLIGTKKPRINIWTKILIYVNDNVSHLADIIAKLSSSGVIISNVLTNIVELKYIYEISFQVSSLKDLENIIRNLEKLDYIVDVERVIKWELLCKELKKPVLKSIPK